MLDEIIAIPDNKCRLCNVYVGDIEIEIQEILIVKIGEIPLDSLFVLYTHGMSQKPTR